MKLLALVLVATGLLIAASTSSAADWRQYAKQQAAKQGWAGAEWQALDAIIRPESAWNPCASYPRRHDCGYSGSNSCGIPQANPCPSAWRGRLLETARAQVSWLMMYVRQRYGSPSQALWFRRAHGWY